VRITRAVTLDMSVLILLMLRTKELGAVLPMFLVTSVCQIRLEETTLVEYHRGDTPACAPRLWPGGAPAKIGSYFCTEPKIKLDYQREVVASFSDEWPSTIKA
jgi:hypothetical protein